MKPGFFSGFLENIVSCILKGVSKCLILFSEKKIRKKYVCLPYLKFSDPLSETYNFLYGLISGSVVECLTRGPGDVRVQDLPGHNVVFLKNTSYPLFSAGSTQ